MNASQDMTFVDIPIKIGVIFYQRYKRYNHHTGTAAGTRHIYLDTRDPLIKGPVGSLKSTERS